MALVPQSIITSEAALHDSCPDHVSKFVILHGHLPISAFPSKPALSYWRVLSLVGPSEPTRDGTLGETPQ